ncbi:MAG: hypothetical protein WA771_14885, partial [Chthoniobacterales bacterium]
RWLPRFGVWVLLGLIVSALAALAKPFVFLLLPELATLIPQSWLFTAGGVVNVTATAFEILLDFYLLTYFTLTAHLWIRGSRLDHRALIHLTARRVGCLAPWGLVVVGLASICVLFPQLAVWAFQLPPSPASVINSFTINWGQPLLATLLLLTVSVPVTLTFRNFRLAAGIADAFRFSARNIIAIVAFLAFAFVGNLIIAALRSALTATFGYESSPALGGRSVLAIVQGIFAGWLVVSWACFYKARVRSRPALSDPAPPTPT